MLWNLLLSISVTADGDATPPPVMREFRAAWVATVDNIDWPSKRTLTTSQQRQELVAILDRAQSLRLNAIIFQVRPSADALYPSKLEPWSEYLTGKQGTPPNPAWDPLQFAIAESRKRGLELHVWLNPYRAFHFAQKGPNHPTHLSNTRPDIVRKYGRYQWMDPGEPDVQQHSLKVVEDILTRYEVDGIHIDDYFYPYKEQNLPFPDDASYAKYTAGGGRLSRDDWRRKNVDDFVRNLNTTVHRVRPKARFGISPFGIYRPGVPAGIKAGVDQYADLYADAKKWLNEGWCDYFTPQLYWPIKQTPQSYRTLLDWWLTENPKKRHLWIGNFTSRTDPAAGNWSATEVIDQINLTRQRGAGGNVHFSMKALMRNYNSIADQLRGKVYSRPALPPATPWLDSVAPLAPKLSYDLASKELDVFSRASDGTRWWIVQSEFADGGTVRWETRVIPAAEQSAIVTIEPMLGSASLRQIWVAAVDEVGNQSPYGKVSPN
ncbi:MAG: family 10 glycosylhydrolase [Fimbriimonadaceae bacterium]|nr:family 10 glycosylhydrolase [Fimbriimonadaceae bacterium]